ncbi:Purple acid phosphatase/fibronectin domain protein [Leucobacter sp. 7(1)]|uniref:chitobiase/beta-hexosaminidase C-terminal domain-containing protein n=1 Tax=Leucobacter sp. 7(1) TaxID=1255613 RepID=UPI00097E8161|nr:chitobiase/beta-hexosaminidase C-terminal domain-containing protein [Leucobacter sp. 7(1)]SJN09497.1 Purple acid phosphatase/fibronectin domain protein [Leucobacter sp. 7(1)]
MSKRKIAALALSGVALLGAQAVFPSAAPAAAVAETGQGVPAAPEISLLSGRYIGPQTVTLTAAAGTEIRYTLDGTHPTRHSALYSAPLSIDASANVSAVAFTDRTASVPAISGILIKTAEEPLAQFAVMSDIHLSTGDEVQQRKWAGYFDTLQRIAPSPDALISNGDQINDNSFNSAADHRFPRAMLEQNLARTGMSDTQVMMTFGNHDDYVTRMAEQYPEEWFPGTTGYYESAIGEFPAFVVNTESWSATQAAWLYGRLSEIAQDPATQHLPIFVFGHRPIPATVWDGAQASNGGLKSNLSDFPQVMYFSGHSHLNITDERSIHQEDFTSVNEGSMSYGENDGKFQIFGAGLARDATIPTAQSVVVDVYADRVEIDRINYAAQPGRTYDDAGNWTFQADPPFASTGSLAGPSWVVARGATPAEVRAKFTYTSANRNTSAPAWGEGQPTVRQTESGPVLRLPQAADDQFAAEYTLSVRDVATDEITDLVPVNGRIYSDYVVAPKPAVLDIPLAVRAGNKVGQPVDRTLTIGREYEATLVAFDSYQNRSEPRAFRFVAGAIDRTPLDAAVAEAESVIAQTSRVLGILTPAEAADYELAIADVPTAEAALAALTELLPEAPATQDAADALSFAVADATAAVQTMLVAVDRVPLGAAIHAAETALDAAPKSGARSGAAPAGVAAAEREFRAQLASAIDLQGTLNVAQPKLDAAAAALTEAQAAWAKAVAEQPGGETPGGETPGGEKPGGKQPGTEQPGKVPGEGTQTAGEGSAGAGKLARTGDAGNVGTALVCAAGLAAAGTLLLGVRRAQRRQ